MSKLLSKLREQSEWYNDGHGPLHKEAVAEIERLLTENESLKLTLIELRANKDAKRKAE